MSGLLKATQPNLDFAYNTLFDVSTPTQPCATNTCGKTNLVRATHTQAWQFQQQQSIDSLAA